MGKKRKAKKKAQPAKFKINMKRRVPVDDPWRYTYLMVGEKKIGKTTFAIEGCEEYVLQYDRPQLSQEIREVHPKSLAETKRVLDALEDLAEEEGEDFPFERIVVDGVNGLWAQITEACLKHFKIDHPSDEEWAKGWHWIRDEFMAIVDRLNALKVEHGCGVLYIAHSEWKEQKKRGSREVVEKLKADLAGQCEKILEGKVDLWGLYDYSDEDRCLVILGDETTGAGHSIDGHFLTPGGDRVREIPMGNNPEEAMTNFMAAFNNEQEYVSLRAKAEAESGKRKAKKKRRKK